MYTRCIHCHAALGANEDVERFPVGKRLAFDAAKGRLWVVCPHCYRWNLTPLEERWEAIETCDRLFRGTQLRLSTDQIGLARLRSGLELVRVGRPLRPEFAAWRYGDRFGRRRRRFLMLSAASSAASSASGGVYWASLFVGLPVVIATAVVGGVLGSAATLWTKRRSEQVVARMKDSSGVQRDVLRRELKAFDLVPDERDRWALQLRTRGEPIRFVDDAALHIGALALAARNFEGGTDVQVRVAVRKLEWLKGPEGVRRLAVEKGGLANVDDELRLAVEMALHEESERRALEGELALLEHAWREAEELAHIADNLLVPAAVKDWLQSHRQR